MNETSLSAEYEAAKQKKDQNWLADLYRGSRSLSVANVLLLLVAMILLKFSMSVVPAKRFRETLREFPNRVASLPYAKSTEDFFQNPFSLRNDRALMLYEGLANNFGKPREDEHTGGDRFYGSDLIVRAGDGFLSVSLLPSAFAGGIDELSRSAQDTIGLIGKTFADSAFEIRIESMALLGESAKGLFGSDVELSTARGMAVLRQFLDAGVDAQSLNVGSYGSSKRGIAGDRSLRWLPSERVDIVISLRK